MVIVFLPFAAPPVAVPFVNAFDLRVVFGLELAFALESKLTSTVAFAAMFTLRLALAFTVTREYATPPTKLTTEPSRNAVFAKLAQTFTLSRGFRSVEFGDAYDRRIYYGRIVPLRPMKSNGTATHPPGP